MVFTISPSHHLKVLSDTCPYLIGFYHYICQNLNIPAMQKRVVFLSFVISCFLLFPGCKSGMDLKKDAAVISEVMCRGLDIQNKLRMASPNDTAAINKLQLASRDLQLEMTNLYQEFKKKWSEKLNDQEFNKRFSDELRKAILNCPHLSKEDREQFQNDLVK
jgi:hypothetical protein